MTKEYKIKTSEKFKDEALNDRFIFRDIIKEYRYSKSLRTGYYIESLASKERGETTMRGLTWKFKLTEFAIERLLKNTGTFTLKGLHVKRFAVVHETKENITLEELNLRLFKLKNRVVLMRKEMDKVLAEFERLTA